MRLRLFPALAILPGTLTLSAATYAPGEIIHNPRKVYDVQAIKTDVTAHISNHCCVQNVSGAVIVFACIRREPFAPRRSTTRSPVRNLCPTEL